MLHVIREYALERLEAVGAAGERVGAAGGRPEAEALRRAHAAWMLDLGERAEPELTGPAAGAWLGRLERDHDNLRAALGWARERGEAEIGLRLVASIWRFWLARGHLREGRAWLEGLLALAPGGATGNVGADAGREHPVPDRVRARALRAGGSLAESQGDIDAARTWLEAAAALGRAAGDPRTAASALNVLGIIARQQDDLPRAAARYEESLALMREVGDRRGGAVALHNLGGVAIREGDLARAAAHYEEALALLREVGDREGVAACLLNLGEVARRRGEVARAAELQREALALSWAVGDRRQCAEGLEQLANTAGVAGHGGRAARLLGAASALRETLGSPQPPPERADTERDVATARADIGEERWAAAFAAGRALALEGAIAEALGEAGAAED
jgi:non-specific serine/threonine protein kinase